VLLKLDSYHTPQATQIMYKMSFFMTMFEKYDIFIYVLDLFKI